MDSLPPIPPADPGTDAGPDPHAVGSLDALLAVYPPVLPWTAEKSSDRIGPATAAFIAASPFCILGTQGPRGIHASPRGDAPGFVQVAGEHTLLLPDRRGNNRLDAMRDILEDPRVTLVFLVPGAGETVRVHGTARITADPALRTRLAAGGREPTTVLVVAVTEVFAHCAKAFMRSGLWDARSRPEGLPTMGRLMAEHKHDAAMDVPGYDAAAAIRLPQNLY